MGILNWFPFSRGDKNPQASTALQSPAFYEFVRQGDVEDSVEAALNNDAVLRACDLIGGTIAMLPLTMMQRDEATGEIREALDHPLYGLLRYQPNPWQTAHEFKQLMQGWLLLHGNAYAQIVRTLGRVSALIPLDPMRVSIETDGGLFPVRYQILNTKSQSMILEPRDVLHLRGFSVDTDKGVSRIKKAGEVIKTARQQMEAANSIYRNGVISGVALIHPGQLGADAAARLKATFDAGYAGAGNAGKTIVLEEGMTRDFPPATAQNAQIAETRPQLTEAIGRIFGVPRPLMQMDDTSWGSGIEQLAMLFVRFGLAPWFSVWEQGITRALQPVSERGVIYPDFDERELLRGTMKDQAEFLAKALGAGGHRPWMEANEARDHVGLGQHPDGGGLIAAGETRNDTSQTA
ncbi:phage portal protein [Yoonia sp.]|uniref:phage portal protein n=1 Tax=Yoonia sp. TaxID=2212373 RepID=UPI002DFBC9F2|nr:phage portal protein [Yoonia sp.]